MEEYTFVIKVDLNKAAGTRKGRNEWATVLYRSGKTFEDAVQQVILEFDNPHIIFACVGKQVPLRGTIIDELLEKGNNAKPSID